MFAALLLTALALAVLFFAHSIDRIVRAMVDQVREYGERLDEIDECIDIMWPDMPEVDVEPGPSVPVPGLRVFESDDNEEANGHGN